MNILCLTVVFQLLLFPEGTDRGERSVTISRSFADKNSLPHYEYLLHPRTTGFTYLLKHMRQSKLFGGYLPVFVLKGLYWIAVCSGNYVTSVYDVTVGYPDEIVSNELELVSSGVTPRNVHFDVRKVPIAFIPPDEEGAGKWLSNLWSEKEEIQSFPYESITFKHK